MPLRDDMHYISVDDHLLEPPDLWTSRLPEKFRERGPCLVETDREVPDENGQTVYPAGSEAWRFDGGLTVQTYGLAVAGIPAHERTEERAPLRYASIRPGCYNPAERVRDMDLDGVQAQLCFPTFSRFAGTRFLDSDDRDLAEACVRAYNDFVLEEWCSYAPDRQIPMVIMPLHAVEASVLEVQRAASMGARAVSFPENPAPLGLPSLFDKAWDPFWSAVQDVDLTVCMHIGTSGKLPLPAADGPYALGATLLPINTWSAVVSLLLSHVLHRFPKLRFAMSEGGIGWIPAALERADDMWEIRPDWKDELVEDVRPSDLFRRNIFGCVLSDHAGLELRHHIGIENIMFESDYPHADSKWPNSREFATKVLADIPDEEVHQIIELNARRVFNFPRS